MKQTNVVARRHLDARFDQLRGIAAHPLPHRGWVRAIREALGMSTTELAARMGTAQSRISALEQGEVAGTLKLETLRRAAEALDCDLVYALVPRTTLAAAVREQAARKAAARLQSVRHHMRLEDQAVSESEDADELEDFASSMIDRRGLWTEEHSVR